MPSNQERKLSEVMCMHAMEENNIPIVKVAAKRTSLEIIAEILSLCKHPELKTHVIYRANLSWKMFQDYLHHLRSMGLLEIHHSPIKYVTTRKGLNFLKRWRELEEILSLS